MVEMEYQVQNYSLKLKTSSYFHLNSIFPDVLFNLKGLVTGQYYSISKNNC